MAKWISAGRDKHGLKYREHDTETVGVGRSKRPLRYYKVVCKIEGKAVSDVLGWENQFKGGIHKIEQIALELKINRKQKTPPFTYRQMVEFRERELEVKKKREVERRRADELQARLIFRAIFQEYISCKPDHRSTHEMVGFYNKWLESDLGDKHLSEIKLLDLQRIQKRMEKSGRAPRTIKTVKEIVRQVYTYAAEHELYFGVKPTVNFLKSQKLNNRREEYYSRDQAEQLLQTLKARSIKTYRIALLSLNTGMRFGEIASLQWQHVNISRRKIIVVDPKNGENRLVYMVDAIVEMFDEMDNGQPGELVFPDSNGKVMGKVSNTFPKVIKDLGFNEGIDDRRLRLGFHSLRHTAASWMANKGVDMHVIAKVLGHKTLAMTMRYSHINDDSVKDAMEQLEN